MKWRPFDLPAWAILAFVLLLILVSWALVGQAVTDAQGTATVVATPGAAPTLVPPTPVPTATPPVPVGGSLQISKDVRPSILVPGEEATVCLRVRGLSSVQCAGLPGRPVDALLVIDNSASASHGPGSNLDRTEVLAMQFLDNLSQQIYERRDLLPEISRAGLIVNDAVLTNTQPLLLQPLTEDVAMVRAQLPNITPGSDVLASDLVRAATNQLLGRDPNRSGLVLLFLHDRQPLLTADFEQAVREAQQVGIKVLVVANTYNVPSQDRILTTDLEPPLQPSEYWLDPSPDQMRAVFVQAADGAVDLAARDIQIVDQFQPSDGVTILDVGQGGYLDGDKVVWDLHHLRQADEVVLTYQIYVSPNLAPGRYVITSGGGYLDCNGYPVDRPLGSDPPLAEVQVSVQSPTPVPTPAMVDPEGDRYRIATPDSVFTQTHPYLEAEHRVDPSTGLFRQDDYEVTVTLFGTGEKCPPTVRRYTVDALLVLDHSGSMAEPFGTSWKLEEAKRAAQAFVDEFAQSGRGAQADRVGVIVFDDGANLVHELSEDRDSLNAEIEQIQMGGGTDIAGALQQAFETLKHSERARVPQVIVLLSDGWSDYASAVQMARTIKDEDIRIVTVGVGYGTDDRLLRDVASDLGDYYFAAPGDSLEDMFRTIALRARRPIPATDIRVVHTYDMSKYEIVRGSSDPSADTDQPGLVIWQIDQVDEPYTTLTYRIRPLIPGLHPVLKDAEVVFVSCEARDESIQKADEDNIETDTILPSRALTTTIPYTVPQQINPPAYGTAESSRLNEWRARVCSQNETLPVCWPAALLLLFLLLLVLWLIFGRRLRGWWRNPNTRRWCKIFAILLLLWLLAFIPLLAKALATGVCADQGTLIFWRIQEQDSQLYHVPPGPSGEVEQLEVSEHEKECVGCHIVSGGSKLMALSAEPGREWAGAVTIQRTDGLAGSIAGLHGSYFSWSPDGHKLAYSYADRDIHILDLDTRTDMPLPGASEPNLVETMPAWSADGGTIAFVRPEDPTSGGFAITGLSDIYAVPVVGGTPTVLTGMGDSKGGLNYYPQYSPNGRWLIFTNARRGSSYANPDAKIYIMPAAGGNPLPIQANNDASGNPIPDAANSWATWSADNEKIYFSSKRDGNYDTYEADFREVEQETPGGVEYDWTTGPAIPITKANSPAFEHLAYYADPAEPVTIFQILAWAWPAIRRLWPLLLLLPILVILWILLCREIIVRPEPIPASALPPGLPFDPWEGPAALWDPDPALIVGLGGTGRRVLAYLKKNLQDAGAGKYPKQVHMVLIDTADEEKAAAGRIDTEFAGIGLEKRNDNIHALSENLDSLISSMGRQEETEPEIRAWFPVNAAQGLSQAQRHLSQGTGARRWLARAGLFREMQLRFSKPDSLWQQLLASAKEAKDDEGYLRLVLIGSLAGGLASGILADIAYLLRRAGKLAGAELVTIEAYLVTDKAFSALMDERTVAATNTYAALRELGRLQMANRQAVAFRYRRSPGDDVLDGKCDWRLLDEAYLFDGGQLMGEPPIRWLYPTMADAVTLVLDPQSRTGGAFYRKTAQDNATREQEDTGEAVVSGLGSFQVRTPLPDMIEALVTRWAIELLTLLVGKPGVARLSAGEGGLGSDPMKTRAYEFLVGRHSYGADVPGAISSGAIEQVLAKETTKRLLEHSLKQMKLGNSQQEKATFRRHLNGALEYLLCGADRDPIEARSGKIEFSLGFLVRMDEMLEQVASNATGYRGLGRTARGQLEKLAQMVPVCRAEVAAARQVLEAQRDLIRPPASPSPELKRIGSLLGRLDERRQQLLAWRADMSQILTRRYLGYEMEHGQSVDDVLNDWYRECLQQHLKEYLARLYWAESDGEVHLRLRTWYDVELRAEESQLDRFADELLQLGRYAAREIWTEKRNALAELLGNELADSSQADKLLDQVWDGSVPLMEYDPSRARSSTLNVTLAGTPEALQTGRLDRRLLQRQQALRQLTPVEIKDPCSLTTVQRQDLVPLSASCAAEDAYDIYQRRDGLLWGNEPSAVLAAEEHARALEARLPEIHQKPRPFQNVVVAGLEDMGRARLYALAYAGGFVALDRDGSAVSLDVPDRPGLLLTRPETNPLVHPVVKGLLAFADLSDEQVQFLADVVNQPTAEMTQRWQAWMNGIPQGDPLARSTLRGAKDLGDVIALLVRKR